MASPLLATRAGLDENEDRAVPVELACGAGSAAQPTKQVAPEGKERTTRNIWVDELLKSRLELGICYCQRFEPG